VLTHLLLKGFLHLYYGAVCNCGHYTKAEPGVGYVSVVEGRKKNLCIQEYALVGPMLATFIASLAVRRADVSTKNTGTII